MYTYNIQKKIVNYCCASQMEYFRVREINRLTGLLGSAQTVLEHLRSLVQVTSKLAFAVRASSFSPDELNHLDLLSRDVVGF